MNISSTDGVDTRNTPGWRAFSGISEKPLRTGTLRTSASSVDNMGSAFQFYEEGYRKYRSGLFSESEKLFLEALRLEPNLLKAHYWLGKVYREMGMLKEAVFHWEEVLRIQTLIRERRMALTIENNEYPAEVQIGLTKQREKEAADAFQKGKHLLDEGHWDGATAQIKEAITLYPSNPEYLRMLGRLLSDRGDVEGCMKVYADLLAVRNLPKEWALDAVDCLIKGGGKIAARQGLKTLARKFPKDKEISDRLSALEEASPTPAISIGKVVQKLRGQVVLDVGLESGLKLADEYNLRLRAFKPGNPVTDPQTGRELGRTLDNITGELLVTKVFANSCWALVRHEFGQGIKIGDLIEIKSSTP